MLNLFTTSPSDSDTRRDSRLLHGHGRAAAMQIDGHNPRRSSFHAHAAASTQNSEYTVETRRRTSSTTPTGQADGRDETEGHAANERFLAARLQALSDSSRHQRSSPAIARSAPAPSHSDLTLVERAVGSADVARRPAAEARLRPIEPVDRSQVRIPPTDASRRCTRRAPAFFPLPGGEAQGSARGVRIRLPRRARAGLPRRGAPARQAVARHGRHDLKDPAYLGGVGCVGGPRLCRPAAPRS